MKFLGSINEAPVLSIGSGSTVPIGVAQANTIIITGTTTITGFDTAGYGVKRTLLFPSVLTLTYNATSMRLLSGANIVTAPGDVAIVMSLGGGNWQMINYVRASGNALIGGWGR